MLSLHGKEESRVQMELMLTINWLYNRETSLDYPGGTNRITRVLTRGRQEAQSERRHCVCGSRVRGEMMAEAEKRKEI